MTTYIAKSVYGADDDETVSEWVMKECKAKETEEQRAIREMEGPPVYVKVPYTFIEMHESIIYKGVIMRLCTKWGVLFVRTTDGKLTEMIVLHGRRSKQSGCKLHIENNEEDIVFSFRDESICKKWHDGLKPCMEKWEIGKYYEIAVGKSTGQSISTFAIHRVTGTRVVLRQFCWEVAAYRNTFEHALMECNTYANLTHPNVHQACDVLISESTAYTVLPMLHGTLPVMNYPWNKKSQEQVRELAFQLLSGVGAIHKSGHVIHCLNSESVGYVRKSDGSLRYIITDLSGLEKMNERGVVPWKCYTSSKPQYAAPETKGMINYVSGRGTTPKVDVFAVGCVLGEFVLNLCMYGRNASNVLRRDKYDFRPNLKMWNVADPEMKRFIALLVEPKVSERPTVSQALQHPWMRNR